MARPKGGGMGATPKRAADEPDYKRSVAIVGSIVGVVSVSLNLFLGITAWRTRQERAKLDVLLRRGEAAVDLETRYYVVSGLGLLEMQSTDPAGSGAAPAVVQNSVWRDLQPWFETWETGGDSLVLTEEGASRAHGVLLLRVSNRGKQVAQRVVLAVRGRDFPSRGGDGPDIWELQASDPRATDVRLADLNVGQSVLVPLAHLLGTSRYFGPALLPQTLMWYNAALQEQKSTQVEPMAPEEQWISRGLNVYVAQ